MKAIGIIVAAAVLWPAAPAARAGDRVDVLADLQSYYLEQRDFWESYAREQCAANDDAPACAAARNAAVAYNDLLNQVDREIRTGRPYRLNRRVVTPVARSVPPAVDGETAAVADGTQAAPEN